MARKDSRPCATSAAGRYAFVVPAFPEPGAAEAVNLGEPTLPRPAATVILLRDGDESAGLEVLLLKRSSESRFMPNVWVFPGGSLDPEDGEGMDGLTYCARRELGEEAGIHLHPDDEMVPLARWVTPEVVSTRFDTWFFLARAPARATVRPDGYEMTAARWVTPALAVEQANSPEHAVVFPTLKQLEALAPHPDVTSAMKAAREDPNSDRPVLPKVIGDHRHHRIVLPHEDDYPA
jgi:8-oxo-dGTP pyrophosphatase MutT (NUDIX family)